MGDQQLVIADRSDPGLQGQLGRLARGELGYVTIDLAPGREVGQANQVDDGIVVGPVSGSPERGDEALGMQWWPLAIDVAVSVDQPDRECSGPAAFSSQRARA